MSVHEGVPRCAGDWIGMPLGIRVITHWASRPPPPLTGRALKDNPTLPTLALFSTKPVLNSRVPSFFLKSTAFLLLRGGRAEGSFSRVRCSCTSHWVPTSPNRRTADTADPSLLKPSGTATLPSGRRGADAAALRLCPKRHGLASVGRAAAARREWRTAGGWCFTRGWTSIFHPKDERGLVFQACTRNTINKTRTRAAIISCRTQHSRAAPNITPCR